MNRYILLFAMLVLLAGCRSSKHVTSEGHSNKSDIAQTVKDDHHTKRKAEQALIRQMAEERLDCQGLTANARVRLIGTGKDIGVNGKLFMKRDEMVRLSLRFIGMELGVLEFTPNEVLVVDRFHKQYVRVGYDQVDFLRQAELDFQTVQSLFWNELFVPGKKDVANHTDRFVCTQAEGRTCLQLTDTRKLQYAFFTSAASGRVEELQVRKEGTDVTAASLDWKYGTFEKVGAQPFPHFMKIQSRYHGKSVGLELDLSGMKVTSAPAERTSISSRYTQRTVDEVLKGLKQ